jgi:glucose-6-phosphate 1-dehydrogenase
VQITAAETVGVENRAAYYEEAGTLRDMVQNHMLQLVALTAMEPPAAIGADEVRAEKVKVLRAVPPVADSGVVRGQYGPGWVEDKRVPGYRSEPGVNPNSITETFVALKLFVENWRWAGVPFFLRSGKRMPKRLTEISIQFRQAPLMLFDRSTPADQLAPNLMVIRIQPDEGISLKFSAKQPGPALHVRPVNMDFRYATSFGSSSAGGYERLLLDCMLGDATLFAHRDEVEAAWGIVTPILQAWQKQPPPNFPNYEAGSWGPPEADTLMQSGACEWRVL